jgi:hypothetical protein
MIGEDRKVIIDDDPKRDFKHACFLIGPVVPCMRTQGTTGDGA